MATPEGSPALIKICGFEDKAARMYPMAAALALSLLLAAPPYVKDVRFALKTLEKECGHFFKLKGIDWPKVRRQFLKEAKKVKTDEDHYALFVRLLARLRDGHAYVQTKQRFSYPGAKLEKGPALFFCLRGKKVYVKSAWRDAEGAGVKPGMEVVSVDKVPARKWLDKRVEVLRDTIGFGTDHHALFYACHWGLMGPSGSRLKLDLKKLDRKTKKATLPRTSKSGVPWGPAFPPECKRIGRQAYGKTKAGHGYIHLRDVPRDLPAQLDSMLAALGDIAGLVLDCRANGGGGCDHEAVFGRFVRKGKTWRQYRSQGEAPFAGPIVVIVDGGVRSAGETVSGMFKEDGRAYMIGPSPTAGTSSSKKTIELPSKLFSLYVSVRSNKKRFNGGKGIEGIGVPPHEIVEYDPKDLAAGVDTLIRRADALLSDWPRGEVPYKHPR